MISKLNLTLVFTLLVTGLTQTSAQENGEELLGRFVGIWQLNGEARPSKWIPDGGTISGQESTVWGLKKRVILTQAIEPTENKKSFFVSTYDPVKNVYPFWLFDSKGLMGAEWELTWDAASKTTDGHATDLPTGWTSSLIDKFPDSDTNDVTAWIKDDVGEVLLNNRFTKKRLPDKDGPAIAATWSKIEARDDLPAELKVLERMIGTWDEVSIQKPAVWAPEGGRVTAKVTRQWILDGRLIMDTSILSDGRESINLRGFDPQSETYRSWWFNSEGHRNTATGTWNEKSQTISWVSKLDDGKTMHFSIRFPNRNQEVVDLKVTDADGRVYFDMDSIVTRRSASEKQLGPDAIQPKSTEQSRLQGKWGATRYVQNGQGAGEAPIAPEDSAIQFVFTGNEFLLLASGNAGKSPKGTYKLGAGGKGKTIDLTFPPASTGAKKQTMSGIYEFDGDTLKITYAPNGASRPADFKSAGGSKHVAIVFKRVKE